MGPANGFLTRQMHARPLACFTTAFLLGVVFRRHLDVSTAVCAGGTVDENYRLVKEALKAKA